MGKRRRMEGARINDWDELSVKRKRNDEKEENDWETSSTDSQSSNGSSTSSTSEGSVFGGDRREKESPEFNKILKTLSKAVLSKSALELLHSMATSKDILFWTPKGQLLYRNRRIPVTNIAELIEYILLPYNPDVSKPRALNTFLEGIAELGISKHLIKNKKVLADVIVKENEIQNENESEEDDETNSETSSKSTDQSEVSESERSEKSEMEDKNSDYDSSSGQETEEEHESEHQEEEENQPQSCKNCGSDDQCFMIVVKCPKCKWHEGAVSQPSKINSCLNCELCSGSFGLNRKSLRDILRLCNACGFLSHTNVKSGREQHFEAEEEMITDSEE